MSSGIETVVSIGPDMKPIGIHRRPLGRIQHIMALTGGDVLVEGSHWTSTTGAAGKETVRGGVGKPGGGRTGPGGVSGSEQEVGPAADESIPGEGDTGADADDVRAGGSLPRPRGACAAFS